MVDESFTGELKWYKLSDDRYILLRPKSDQKNQTWWNKNLMNN